MEKIRKIIFLQCFILFVFVVPIFAQGYPSLSNFEKKESFEEGCFLDVKQDEWYYENVKKAYELGLMKGSSDTFFNADGSVTIAEAITMVARLHSIYNTGEDVFEQTTPWYKTYVEYALRNKIINEDFVDYDKKANRDEFAYIFSNALPDDALQAINTIEDGAIPDVSMLQEYADSIYRLYRAGVLTGNDEIGTFSPKTTIQRSAVATIITRMAKRELRVKNKLVVKAYFPLEITGVNYTTDFIGTTMLNIEVKNIGSVAIDAFEYYSLVYDAYGEPIYYYGNGSNEFTGTWSRPIDQALLPNATVSGDTYWTYYGFNGIKEVQITLTKAHSIDGKTYELDEDHYTWTGWSW